MDGKLSFRKLSVFLVKMVMLILRVVDIISGFYRFGRICWINICVWFVFSDCVVVM